MSGRVFFDTNVLAYAFDRSDPAKSAKANKLMMQAVADRRGVVSYQVLQELLNVGFRKFKVPLDARTASLYLQELTGDMDVVDWSVALMEQALLHRERYRFSWYDSLIVAAALEGGCSTLYTEDLQHGQRMEGLTVVDPFR